MPLKEDASHAESQLYYEDFSLKVGLRDWLKPNPRHARLRVLVADLIDDRRGLRLLDVGCGAGVMTSYLTRYGVTVGSDFSSPAIDAAGKLVPDVMFYPGTLEEVAPGAFDVITLFDVLEHIRAADRPAFLSDLATRLTRDGRIFASTPHPAFTHRRRVEGDPTLQIIDEEVEVGDIAREALDANLRLIRYEAYDVFAGSPEYQAFVFAPVTSTTGPARLLDTRTVRPTVRRWRLTQAARVLRHGHRRAARWFVSGTAPEVMS